MLAFVKGAGWLLILLAVTVWPTYSCMLDHLGLSLSSLFLYIMWLWWWRISMCINPL